ncbi:MAG: DnaA/Hda family protein, partial [Acidobacteriota bacterium]|nr:DnaA/Hda family protein [Acidobacteriota bacterium]
MDWILLMSDSVWDQVLGRIETKINQHSFYTWFKPTTFVDDSGEVIQVKVRNRLVKDWLTKHYKGVISEALDEVNRSSTTVSFVTDEEKGQASGPPQDAPPQPTTDIKISSSAAGLNPRYSFDTFIVGPSNQFAHAACRAVAEAPSRSYNPLYIYGGVGLGKTHLMNAIGQFVLEHNPRLKLTYISSERFMNEMINAVRFDSILEFRER